MTKRLQAPPRRHDLELALKAVSDSTRARILMLLVPGGLCGCQVQATLGLAASTVSKHLSILKTAGLVADRRDGKWVEYALAEHSPNAHSRPVLDLVRGALDRDPVTLADRVRRREVLAISRAELCARG